MSFERAPMRKVREVLRLKHSLGASARQIAVSVGVSRSTIGNVWRAAVAAAGAPAGTAFHELRHLYASLLIRHGESVKVVQGPLSDFTGEIAEINTEQARLKVLVSIFGRETPADLSFEQVKKLT